MTWDHLSAWLDLYRGAGIQISRIEISRDEAEKARTDALDRWTEALTRLPYLCDYYEKGQWEFWNRLLGGMACRDLTASVFGFTLRLGSEDMDSGFRIVPVRDPLVFGASA